MKYIFVAGAPGSKWSSVCKNIYFSGDIDTSDYNTDRLHQNLEYNTPSEIYHGEVKLDNYFDKLTSIIL